MDLPSIRIAIIGDCGVGKSTLACQLSHFDSVQSTIYTPTIGCSTSISQIKDPVDNSDFFVEIMDLGGSPRFESSRSTFYDDLDGVIFLWDCSSEYTFHSIDLWLAEIKVVCILTYLNE